MHACVCVMTTRRTCQFSFVYLVCIYLGLTHVRVFACLRAEILPRDSTRIILAAAYYRKKPFLGCHEDGSKGILHRWNLVADQLLPSMTASDCSRESSNDRLNILYQDHAFRGVHPYWCMFVAACQHQAEK